MHVLGTVQEINDVLKGINPNFPEQHLETLESDQAYYVVNRIPVWVTIMDSWKDLTPEMMDRINPFPNGERRAKSNDGE